MKKIVVTMLMLLGPLVVPIVTFAQQEEGWTPEQQEQFRQQMEEFKLQMQSEMEQLRDSLARMEERLKEEEWSEFDSANWNFNWTMPELPEIPEPPTEPDYYDSYGNPHYHDYGLLEVDPRDDSTEVRVGKWKLTVEENEDGEDKVKIYKDENDCDDDYDNDDLKNIRTKFLLLDIGLNNYFAPGLSSNFPSPYQPLEPIPGKSWVVNLHVFNQRVNLIQHKLWISYGAFFEFNDYKFSSDEVLVPRVDSVAFITSEVPLKKNKLTPTYVGIPVTFRFETNPYKETKSFHISVGGFGEYLIGSHTKTKSTTNQKTKQKDDFNLNRFRYGITGRFGYAWVNLFVNYSFSEFFEKDTGPVLYPASAGLAFEF